VHESGDRHEPKAHHIARSAPKLRFGGRARGWQGSRGARRVRRIESVKKSERIVLCSTTLCPGHATLWCHVARRSVGKESTRG
jgi:hypothetical protein